MSDFNIKNKQEKKNYLKISKYHEEEKSEKIELNFDLINGKLNYSYILYLENPNLINNNKQNSNCFQISNENQTINILKYKCEYTFGKEQKINLNLKIKDSNNFNNYQINITVGEIIGNENSTKTFYIKGEQNLKEEILEIKAIKLEKNIQYLTIHFQLKIVSNKIDEEISDLQKDKYFVMEKNKLYFIVEKNNEKLYESETFTDDGKFNMAQIPCQILNDNFSIAFLNWRNQKICTINTSIKDLVDVQKKGQLFFSKQISLSEKLNIYNFSTIREEITFLDYINKGIRIGLNIGIDFTGSNGSPDESDSLHYWGNPNNKNSYERAISSCASIIGHYDYDKLFPVYGFGAIIKGQKKASMCFNINFKDDPNIKYVENIMKEYHDCLEKIYFSGPTNFAPIINKIISDIKKQNNIFEYQILMILTDGMIDDLQDTIDALVEGSYYPLSVIIVGIGNADFSKMEQLDGDEIPLISREGIKRQRDLVQFVPFNKFEGDEIKLSEEVLEEIPRQVIEYYTLQFLYPDLLDNKDNNIKINDEEEEKINDIPIGSIIYEGSINPLDNSDFNIGKKNIIDNTNNEKKFYNYNEIDRKFSGKIYDLDRKASVPTNNLKNSLNIKKNYSINSNGSIISTDNLNELKNEN